MSAHGAAAEGRTHQALARHATIASYVFLGTLLIVTRLVGLGRSFWHDELDTIVSFIRGGPGEILAGAYRPNNHELFNLLAWATTKAVGESELALRLWSVLPFLAGVALVVVWLHLRVEPLTANLFLGLAAFSPLLLDLTRQARGYGLVFLAMAVVIVAALEADREGTTWAVLAFCAAGVVGTWTLPNFGLAFVATGAVLLTNPRLRRRVAVGGGASLLLIAAWYAPHVDELLESSRQDFGAPIPWYGLITSPVEQVVAPALLWIDGAALTTDLSRLPLVAAFAIVLAVSPLLRDARTGLILGAGPAFTLLIAWAAQLYLSPRFVSYLLVPLLIITASGLAHLLTHQGARGWLRACLAFALLVLVVIAFGAVARSVLTLPREAHRDAVHVVRANAQSAPVLAYTYHPSDLEYYLGRPVEQLTGIDAATRACGAKELVVYATQPFGIRPAALPCARREGVRRYRLEQYTRGGEIIILVIPPAHHRER